MPAPRWFSFLIDSVRRVRKLGALRRPRSVPYIQQNAANECGLACLAATLALHGKDLPVRVLRDRLEAGRDGTNAADLLHLAEHNGLAGRGLRVDRIEDLARLPQGAILHWRFNHFVVFDRPVKRGLRVMDPASGRRLVPWEEVSRSFTGVAVELRPTDAFSSGKTERGRSGVLRDYARVIVRSGHVPQLLALSATIQLLGTATPLFTALLVDRIVPRRDYGLLLTVAAALVTVAAFSTLFTFVRSRLMVEVMSRIDARLTVSFVDHLMELPFSFLQNRSSGDLMLRMNSHVQIRNALTSTAFSAVLDGLFVLSYLVLMLLIDAVLAGLVVLLGVLRVSVYLLTRARQRDLVAESIRRQTETRSYQVRMLAGMEALKSTGAERQVARKWTDLFIHELNVGIEQNRLTATVRAASGALRSFGVILVLVVGAQRVLDGHLSLGIMLAMVAFATGFLGPLSSLVGTISSINLVKNHVERIEDIIEAAPERSTSVASSRLPDAREITVDHVFFRYSSKSPHVLRDVSMQIRSGEFVAFVGRSGAGKSTLAKLLLGLYTPTKGQVLYSGIDLRSLDVRAMRRQIGTVTQTPWYAADSVRENIALGNPDMTLAEVMDAARLAGIHDEIAKLPLGYDTMLYDGGFLMSGGQMQRLALARAVANNPPVLLLDEATSHLDTRLEAQIQERLSRLSCTRIVIAQRLNTIRDADRIIVLRDGAIAEEGRHEDLLAQEGEYAALVRAREASPGTAESEASSGMSSPAVAAP